MQWCDSNRLLLILLLCYLATANESGDYKRLLLTDPDVLSSRLGHLESSLHDILTKYTAQDTIMQNLQTKYTAQKAEMQTLQTQYTKQATDMQNLQTKYTAQDTEMQTLKSKLALQENTIVSLTSSLASHNENYMGSTYVRWGRTSCDANNTEKVYSGYAAGEKYHYGSSYYGGASNFLCLPESPELSTKTPGGNSYLYSVEYEDGTIHSGAIEQDMPCAVCKSKNATSTVMIPARKTCFPGWKREYHGIIVSGAFSNAASEFVCLDENPEYVPGGQASTNGREIWSTGFKCGSLLCPPFKENLQVLCVVCSK